MTKVVARKLGLNPGMRALIIAPPPGYLKLLRPLPEGLRVSAKTGAVYPFVQVFATRLPDIKKFAKKLRKCATPKFVLSLAPAKHNFFAPCRCCYIR